MIPEGWVYLPIKELCESIVDCVNKTAPVVDYETPYKMIRTTNVRHGKVDTINVRCVAKETFEKWVRRGAPKKGDIIFTREAPVGETGLLDSNDMLFLGQRTMMYRADRNKSNNLFILYSLQTRFCQKQIENFSNGGTVAHMRVPDCGEIILRVPPLPEQKKIAQILSTWDKAIETVEKLIENSQQKKKALMQQLLTGKKRFPEFDGEWKEAPLKQLCIITKGKQLNKSTLSKQGLYPVINGGIEPSGYTDKFNCIKGTITISEGGNSCGYVGLIRQDFWCGGHCYTVSPKTIENMYLYHYLKFNEPQIMRLRVGSGLPNIQKKAIESVKVRCPSSNEQQKIASVLSSADQETETWQKELSHLKQEKKALMQQLLTGKRRVKAN